MTHTARLEQPVDIATFYEFAHLPDYRELRAPLLELCQSRGARGTILLAEEGINGTVAAAPLDLDTIRSRLRGDPRLTNLSWRQAHADAPPFRRMKVKTRDEIVTLGIDGLNPNTMAGTYVSPRDWNDLISRRDVVVIDTRNEYEVAIGSFHGARDPGTRSFSELPDWIARQADLQRQTPVAMYCTGGIRCEKSTAYLRKLGFGEVYHLDGGILNYLQSVPESESLWQGECFVFDERVTVTHGLRQGRFVLCAGCGRPIPKTRDAGERPNCGRCTGACTD